MRSVRRGAEQLLRGFGGDWPWLLIAGVETEGLVRFGEFSDNFEDIECASCGFASAVEFFANAPCVGLFFVVDDEDFVNDGGGVIDS